MTTSIKLGMLAVLGVTAGMAAPMCTTGTYDTYFALGAGGCTLGGETFSGFNINPPVFITNTTGVPTSMTQILITPTAVGNDETLAFSYETTTGAPLVISLTDGAQLFALGFSYIATPAASTALTSMQMTSTFSNTTPGSVSATKIAVPNSGGTTFTSAVNDGGVNNVNNTYLGPVMAIGSTGAFSIRDTISLQAQTGAVTDTGFSNRFVTAPIPEPPASILIGGGLLLISSLVRRVSSRRRMNA